MPSSIPVPTGPAADSRKNRGPRRAYTASDEHLTSDDAQIQSRARRCENDAAACSCAAEK